MTHYADIYVIKQTRTKAEGLAFLNHFLSERVESSKVYEVPQYGERTEYEFCKAEDLMDYLEKNQTEPHAIYWRNTDQERPNHTGMLFYTKDGHMIFGISRPSAGIDNLHAETECLAEMMLFLETEAGYFTYECPPETSFPEFMAVVRNFRRPS